MKSILLINGNDPKALLNSTLYGADAVAYDLNEAVADTDKDTARLLVEETLSFFDFGNTAVLVRINPLDEGGLEDIAAAGKGKPHAVMLPKASPESVRRADEALAALEKAHGFAQGGIKLIPVVECANGIANASALATASARVTALAFNGKKFLTSMNTPDNNDPDQLLYARSCVAVACRAGGLAAVDGAFYDVKNAPAFEADAVKARGLGFNAKIAASGSQVPIINTIFA